METSQKVSRSVSSSWDWKHLSQLEDSWRDPDVLGVALPTWEKQRIPLPHVPYLSFSWLCQLAGGWRGSSRTPRPRLSNRRNHIKHQREKKVGENVLLERSEWVGEMEPGWTRCRKIRAGEDAGANKIQEQLASLFISFFSEVLDYSTLTVSHIHSFYFSFFLFAIFIIFSWCIC